MTRPSAIHDDALRRLDVRVHQLYLNCEAEGPEDDADFIDLHGLMVECDPEVNRLLRILRHYVLRDPEMAA